MVVGAVATVTAAHLQPAAAVAWDAYVAMLQMRLAGNLSSHGPFLDVDRPSSDRDRHDVLAGTLVVREIDDADANARPIEDGGALAHHWRGTVLIPKTSLQQVLAVVNRAPAAGPDLDVLRASVIGRRTDGLTIYLRLQKRGFLKAVYDTEHDVTIKTLDAGHAVSRSVATKIVEVVDAGTPNEHPASPAEDRGFLWRLNAYWRYEATAGGVLAECESVTLSRGVPFGLGYVAGPLIDRAARESMTRTLETFRTTVETSRRDAQP